MSPRCHWSAVLLGFLLLSVVRGAGAEPSLTPRLTIKPHGFIHGDLVGGIAFSADGKLLGTRSWDRTMRIWDVATCTDVRQFHGLAGSFGGGPIAFSNDGKVLAATDGEWSLHFWDVATGRTLAKLPNATSLTALAFAPDGKHVAVAGSPKQALVLLDWAAGKEVVRYAGPKEEIEAVAFAPDGSALAAAYGDKTVRLWEPASGRELRVLQGHTEWVRTLAFAADGKTLAAGDGFTNGQVILWDVAAGKELRRISSAGRNRGVIAVRFSRDGSRLVAVEGNDTVRVWETATGKELRCFEPPDLCNRRGGLPVISPDGRFLADRGPSARGVALWDLEDGKPVHEFAGHGNSVERLAVAPDGKRLASAAVGEEPVLVWDLASGRKLHFLPDHSGGISALTFSPDGKTLAAARALGNVFHLWDPATGQPIRRLEYPGIEQRSWFKPARNAVFSPDSKTLFTAVTGRAWTWDVAAGKRVQEISLPAEPADEEGFSQPVEIGGLALSADGTILVLAHNNGEVLFYSTANLGKPLRRFRGQVEVGYNLHQPVVMTFSPDGKTLALSGGLLGTSVHLAEVLTGSSRGRIVTPRANPHAVFTPDGRFVVSWSNTGPAAVWDPATQKISGKLVDRDDVSAVAFLPGGRGVVTGHADAAIRVWDDVHFQRPRPVERSVEEVTRFWNALAADDGSGAYQAVHALAASPGSAVPFLRERLQSVPERSIKDLKQLIIDLESPQFGARQKATEKLEELGDLARPALEEFLAGKPSLDATRRAQTLLDRLAQRLPPPEMRRAWRSIEVLELIGSDDARQVLRKLADGAPEAPVTRDARAALERLAQRGE